MAKSNANHSSVVKRMINHWVNPLEVAVKDGFNPRFDYGDIESLSNNIVENGMLNPIRVRENDQGQLELMDGHRRLKAVHTAIEAGHTIEMIPAVIERVRTSEADALVITLSASEGKNFLPLEEAEAYRRLISPEIGMTIADVQRRTGRSRKHVNDRLRLLSADKSVQEALSNGTVGIGEAVTIAKAHKDDKEAQKKVIEKVKSGEVVDIKALKSKSWARNLVIKAEVEYGDAIRELEDKDLHDEVGVEEDNKSNRSLSGLMATAMGDPEMKAIYKQAYMLGIKAAMNISKNVKVA